MSATPTSMDHSANFNSSAVRLAYIRRLMNGQSRRFPMRIERQLPQSAIVKYDVRMKTYVALLRAVNVGGTGKMPMADLRALAEAAGLREVRTYIQSGNLVLNRQSDICREIGA